MNKKLLIVIDAQNDFITGALRNEEAIKTLPNLVKLIKQHEGDVIATHDTHFNELQCSAQWPPVDGQLPYEKTMEGQKLPVPHCIKLSDGWELAPEVKEACQAKDAEPPKNFFSIDKYTFGWDGWKNYLKSFDFDEIEICGFVSSICVLANSVILRALYPNMKITVYEDCIADITPEGQAATITCLKAQQIDVEKKFV